MSVLYQRRSDLSTWEEMSRARRPEGPVQIARLSNGKKTGETESISTSDLREHYSIIKGSSVPSSAPEKSGMTFGEAMEALKAGSRVARAGWNGKGMWLCYMPGAVIAPDMVNARTLAYITPKAVWQLGGLKIGAYLAMWTADGTWQPGWLASQPDMLANDWTIVPGRHGDVGADEV